MSHERTKTRPQKHEIEHRSADYAQFLARKGIRHATVGLTDIPSLHKSLFPFQRTAVEFALRKGRSALFLSTGLGKTFCQLEWARIVHAHTGSPILILAPLAVGAQTVREGARFGIPVTLARDQAEVGPGISITNYDRLHLFDAGSFGGVVLDESSILKSFSGATRNALCTAFAATPFRMACTATPAPNDYMELGNHAEFLGILRMNEMLQRWFINDTSTASQDWRLKGHAITDFWDWISSWAICAASPSDLGDDASDARFVLPALETIPHVVETDIVTGRSDTLFRLPALSATDLHQEKRRSANQRARHVADLVAAESAEPWLIWCDTDYEADALVDAVPDAIEIRGSMRPDEKELGLMNFSEGRACVLITKPRIAGFGLNWQHCARVAFVGVSYSFEQYYQAIRRCWRFGQTRPVHVHVVMSGTESQVWAAMQDKADDHEEMKTAMYAAARRGRGVSAVVRDTYRPKPVEKYMGLPISALNAGQGEHWWLYQADAVDFMRQLPGASIGFSVYSPPFGDLFVYSDSVADMGNSSQDEFAEHYGFLVRELLRITKPGRLCAVHCSDLPTRKWIAGVIGLRDFSGDLIRMHELAGWILHSRITIWKDPVVEMQRTKALGLLYKQLKKDSCKSRTGMSDYVLVFRAPGENPEPVEHRPEDFPVTRWQEWASPVWMNIDQTDVLSGRMAREELDEKHICPLQIDVIERAITLWSNPGDIVFSPFAGIGSEGYVALKLKRRFLGTELKESYWRQACRYLSEAEREAATPTLLDMIKPKDTPDA
jgi:superfamily II DNA or RNA helicase